MLFEPILTYELDHFSANILSFLCFDYVTLMSFAVAFGFTSASFFALSSVVLTDLLGLDRLESALGLSMVFRGISSFMGAPIVGYLFDQTQSYTPGFIFVGIAIFSSGAILLAIPILQRWIANNHNKKSVA